jgi:hypothetical protein
VIALAAGIGDVECVTVLDCRVSAEGHGAKIQDFGVPGIAD